MCGVVGYIGNSVALPRLLYGLNSLEYRGYDSAGVALIENGDLSITRAMGRIAVLEQKIEQESFHSRIGIAHTRWATHGEPSERNAHPHMDASGSIAVVHNGIIENYCKLKSQLISEGYKPQSDTDTEIVALLIGKYRERGETLISAVNQTVAHLKGAYALIIIDRSNPDRLIAVKNQSPLIIARSADGYGICSDICGVSSQTESVLYPEDGDVITVRAHSHEVLCEGKSVLRKEQRVDMRTLQSSLGEYPHYMLKEIIEQKRTIPFLFDKYYTNENGAVSLFDSSVRQKIEQCSSISIIACGTSYHAGLVGKSLIEKECRKPVEVHYASEFRYGTPIISDKTLVIVISQSGETADTLAALKKAQEMGAYTICISNVERSSIARAAHSVVYTESGPEIGVASTKAFTAQLTVLILLTRYLSKGRGFLSQESTLVGAINELLNQQLTYKVIADSIKKCRSALYLGRGRYYPIAMEGALKLKEISYIHAEAFPSAEMKHGPIAMIDEAMPVFIIALKDELYEKSKSTIEEIQARKGRVIALVSEGDREIKSMVDMVVEIPHSDEALLPLLTVIPLQMIAYHTAIAKELDPDKPRNLAKSVTVE